MMKIDLTRAQSGSDEESDREEYKRLMQDFSTQIRRRHRKEIINEKRKILIANYERQKEQEDIKQIRQELDRLSDQLYIQPSQSSQQAEAEEERSQTSHSPSITIVDDSLRDQISIIYQQAFEIQDLPNLREKLYDQDIINQHFGVIGVRKLLQAERNSIQRVIDGAIIPRLLVFMKNRKYPQLQLESVWAITYISAGTTEQCNWILTKGGLQILIQLVKSNYKQIASKAMQTLGNLASDCTVFRDDIIRFGGVSALVSVVEKAESKRVRQVGCWALSNLCRGLKLPLFQKIKPAFVMLCKFIAQSFPSSLQFLKDYIWALVCHLNSSMKAEILLKSGVLPKLIDIIFLANLDVLEPVLKVIGFISAGKQQQINILLEHQVISRLYFLLGHANRMVRREVLFILSNLATRSKELVEQLITEKDLVFKVIEMMETDDQNLKNEAAIFLQRLSKQGDPEKVVEFYLEQQIVEKYLVLLKSDNPKIKLTTLNCLISVVELGGKAAGIDGRNRILLIIYKHPQQIEYIENLQFHKQPSIYEKVQTFLAYFQIEDPLE